MAEYEKAMLEFEKAGLEAVNALDQMSMPGVSGAGYGEFIDRLLAASDRVNQQFQIIANI